MFALVFLLALQSSAWAQIQLLHGPLLTGATSFTISTTTSTVVKHTPCYIKENDRIPECRRRRGIEEQPQIQFLRPKIAPSAVAMVEATPAPRAIVNEPRFDSETVLSSFDDSYTGTLNVFRQLANKGRNNIITVGDCGRSTVNFSQFLSCLGMTVQETTYLTATFTETTTLSTGYRAFMIAYCVPTKFPYITCPQQEELVYYDVTTDNAYTTTYYPSSYNQTATYGTTTQQFESTTDGSTTEQFQTTTTGATTEGTTTVGDVTFGTTTVGTTAGGDVDVTFGTTTEQFQTTTTGTTTEGTTTVGDVTFGTTTVGTTAGGDVDVTFGTTTEQFQTTTAGPASIFRQVGSRFGAKL